MKTKANVKNIFKKKKNEEPAIETQVSETEAAGEPDAEESFEEAAPGVTRSDKPGLDMSVLADTDADEDDETDEEKKGLSKLFSKKKPRKTYTFDDNPHLLVLRPHEQYMFFSDYIRVDDDTYTCILAMFHNNGALDRFGPFWGLNLLPHNLPKTTKVIRFEQVSRMSDEWVSQHQTRAEKVAESNAGEQGRGGTNTTKRKAGKSTSDLEVIAAELLNGTTYLHVQYRLQIISPSLAELDAAVDQI